MGTNALNTLTKLGLTKANALDVVFEFVVRGVEQTRDGWIDRTIIASPQEFHFESESADLFFYFRPFIRCETRLPLDEGEPAFTEYDHPFCMRPGDRCLEIHGLEYDGNKDTWFLIGEMLGNEGEKLMSTLEECTFTTPDRPLSVTVHRRT